MSQPLKVGSWNIPASWTWIDVASIAETTSGGTPRRDRPEYYGGQIPWLKSGELRDRTIFEVEEFITEEGLRNSSAKVFPPGTLCIALYGATVGKLAILGLSAATNQAVCGIFPAPGIDPRFLFRFLELIRPELVELGKGGAQPNISQGIVRGTFLPLAPSNEQRRIVAEIEKQFTRLDAAVAALKRVQANLKRYRAAVLKAACEGRLVPAEAELARKEGRSYETGEQLLARILKERRAKWEADQLAKMRAADKAPKDDSWKKKYKEPEPPDTSNLPPLPEGWTWATWEQIGFSQNGRPFPSAQYCENGVKLLRPGNLHVSGRVQWNEEDTRCMAETWAQENPDLAIGPSELVMNLTAQSLRDEFLGRICITSVDEHCLLNQRLARLTPIFVRRRFILWLFKSSMFRRFVDGLNTGSLIQHMFTSQLSKFVLPLPPLQEQERITGEVEARLSIIEQNEATCERALYGIGSLRQSILRRAFEGKLVSQDPTDEPAAVLLERIRAERNANSTAVKRSRKMRTFSAVGEATE